jgi:hypothetical protein
MRKIEVQTISAIANRRNFKSANTQVISDGINATVYLHGHEIAKVYPMGEGTVLELCWLTGQHFSRTTFSRQNALLRQFVGAGPRVFTKNHQPCLARRTSQGIKELETGDRYSFGI